MDHVPTFDIEPPRQADFQVRLDQALTALWQTQRARGERGCGGAIGAVLCVLGLIGGSVACADTDFRLDGVAITILSIVGMYRCVKMMTDAFPHLTGRTTRTDAESSIIEVGYSLTGTELLRAGPDDLARLNRRIFEAGPEMAVAILRILATVGDRQSLKIAQRLTRIASNDVHYASDADQFMAGRDPEVHRAAAHAERWIEYRMEVSRRAQTLLRPAERTGGEELLRPALSATTAEPELLLRSSSDGSADV